MFHVKDIEMHLAKRFIILKKQNKLRASYKGNTSGFQPDNGGSIPPARSTYILYHESI